MGVGYKWSEKSSAAKSTEGAGLLAYFEYLLCRVQTLFLHFESNLFL